MEEEILNRIKKLGCRVSLDEKRFFIPNNTQETLGMKILIRNFGWKAQYEIS